MNAAARHALDGIPTPVDEHGAVRSCVVAAGDGWRLAWAFDGGRRKEPFGDTYTDVRTAARASRHLNERTSR